ncbi:UNVERIFIED_CONTAM: protein BIG GRAIN 1-like B [Sesamum angustifolium]|uniref:Protein BIG GRAIN 1-like B n=1 Tax=Sesamum angustifolium TaxID=2727405 RepID=A0AAW2MGN5_9LAMI
MPSFSSTLLDEIYRSIDGNAEDFKAYKEKPVKRQGGLRAKNTTTTSIEDGDVTSFRRRACLVEKWMEKEAPEKVVAKTRPPLLPELDNKSLHDNDLLFFSSTSSSSDSSGALSSSDTEFFGSTRNKPKVSCFSTRPKPVRTGASARESNPREECDSLFDDYENRQRNKVEDELIKSKSRALKIYANLKKVKQPISPGGRLTSFINSLFSNANGKKSRNPDTNKGFQVQDLKSPNSKATSSTTCSSASSFSRSCLSKYSPKSREKMRNGVQRSVRFHPVSVILDEDSRPCGHKCIYGEDSARSPLPPNALEELKLSIREKNRKVEEAAQNALKGYLNKRGDDFSMFRKIHDVDEDDGMSDSSSDLFELDHLALFKQ